MLTDSLPADAESSFGTSTRDRRALREIHAPRAEERRRMLDKMIPSRTADTNTSHAISAHEATKPQIVRKPSDWMAGGRASLVQHAPTKTIFEICARSDLNQGDLLTLDDFRARLVHREG